MASNDRDRKKLGLALSGGGFRASLFHIGMLARLAELGLLHEVEVLSTVSGGSILGAYYYLKLKQLLEGRRSDFPHGAKAQAIEQYVGRSYVTLMQETERDFLAAVQKNLRMRALCNPVKNARMFLSDDYSRSDRMAELYDEYLYLPLWQAMGGNAAPAWRRAANAVLGQSNDSGIDLRAIAITPVAELLPKGMTQDAFDVQRYNAVARYKVPILTINATTLNTGHPWHFTGAWLGEPDQSTDPARAIDTNVVLEQLRFDGMDRANPTVPRSAMPDADHEAKRRQKLTCIKLADAVAASACVPGLFYPLAIHDLHWTSAGDEIVVELVDGGVYDNQGLDALLAAQCDRIVCSDACGQLEDERTPSSGTADVFLRANDILMDRVRSGGYYGLTQALPGDFAFVHLRETFTASADYPAIPGPNDSATKTTGHVYRLSNLRTDLDSFTDLEAYALMYDGYCLGQQALARWAAPPASTLPTLPVSRPAPWRFLELRTLLGSDAGLRRLLNHLDVGRNRTFKALRLAEPVTWLLTLVIVAACGWGLYALRGITFDVDFSVGEATAALLALGAGVLLRKLRLPRFIERALDVVRTLRVGTPGKVISWLPAIAFVLVAIPVMVHLAVFDKLFLRHGRIK